MSTHASWDLEQRMQLVLNTTGEFPTKFHWTHDPYLRRFARAARTQGTTPREIFDRLGGEKYFTEETVVIPSPTQALWAEQIARAGYLHGRKMTNPSIPGSRKTGGGMVALDRINHHYLPLLAPGRRAKLVYVCDSHLIPKMHKQARTFLGEETEIITIKRDTRVEDIRKSALDDIDVILMSYQLSFRDEQLHPYKATTTARRTSFNEFFALRAQLRSKEAAFSALVETLGEQTAREFIAREPSYKDTLVEIIKARARERSGQLTVVEALQQHVLPDDGLYYMVIDEIHNLVSPDSKTALAIGGIFREARWGVALTGTMIGNYIKNDALLAYLLGMVNHPKDYMELVKKDARRVRAVFKPYMVYPVISDIRQIDPLVPEPQLGILSYQPHEEIVRLHVDLENARHFSSGERTLVSRYLLINPKKLHPDKIEGDELSLWERVRTWITEDADRLATLERAIEKGPARVDALRQYLEQEASDEKALIYTVLTTGVTKWLQEQLAAQGLGFELIDQTVHSGINGDAMSPRMLAWQRALYCPELRGLIGSVGTCREGLDGQPYKHIIYYDIPTVPAHKRQADGRSADRSGQRHTVQVLEMNAEGIQTDEILRGFREWKGKDSCIFYHGDDFTPENLETFFEEVAKKKVPYLALAKDLDSRGHLSLFFNANVGIGSRAFCRSLGMHNNHLFMVERFNRHYEKSHSANVGRLLGAVLHEGLTTADGNNLPSLEDLAKTEFTQVVDLGGGSAAYSRNTGRASTLIELSARQLAQGEHACNKLALSGMRYLLGSMHNMGQLVALDSTEDEIFDSEKQYAQSERLRDNSMHLAVCANAFYYLSPEERKEFMSEVKRTLSDNGYLALVIPRSKISEECEEQFLKDIQEAGYSIDIRCTGEYGAREAYDTETRETMRQASFRSVVIIAQNNERAKEYAAGREYFKLHNKYEVRDGRPRKQDVDEAERISKAPRFIYGDFYKAKSLEVPKKETPPEDLQDSLNGYRTLSDHLRELEELGLTDDVAEAFKTFSGVLGDE
jgi:hypothetical protein